MPAALPKIRALAADLPAAEKSIAAAILADPERATVSSVRELARRSRVSVGSVSRFVRTIGFADFRSFRLDLARETATPATSLFEAIRSGDSDDEIARKVFLGNIRSLEDTLKLVATPDLAACARAIGKAGRLVFLGIGGSANVARDAALLFSFLEFPSEAYADPYQIVLQATQARPGDVYFGISHSGRSTITVEGLATAAAKGAATVGISNYPRSPLSRASRFFFCTSFPESRVNVAALTSRLAQLCLLDALYLLVARHRARVRSIEEVNARTERLLRTDGRGGGSRARRGAAPRRNTAIAADRTKSTAKE